MYHHHQQQQQQQQQQGPQAFPSGPRPSQNQPPIRPPTDMMPPPGAYQFPRPTQLPDELESALSVRGSRDMDHRLIEHLDRLKQHQSQTGMSQHGNYGANLCDTQPKQSMDWSNYEPPTKLFGQHPGGQHPGGQHPGGQHPGGQHPGGQHPGGQHPGGQHPGGQHPGGQHPGTGLQNWNSPMSGSSVPPQREGGRGFYTPESAGTILASFGLSNEDLEALSHYPDDQLTPDTLPFILRDLQVHKKPKSSRSPEVPSLLTVTQTEGRVIDYGHASQAKDDSGPPKTFKKEPISSERTVKMYPSPAPKLEARQVRLEPAEPTKHGDRDYRRRSSEHHSSRSPPPRDFSAKPRHQDRDYRLEQPKPRASAEKRSAELTVSKSHPSPSAKPLRSRLKSPSNKKLPTPTMMSDFSGALPKVYPHTCSLCNMECEQEQEWLGHLGTVNHTAACRHLRTKYPDWKPKLPSRDYGKRPAAPHSASRSTSWSPPPPPLDKHRGTSYKLKPYAPHHVARPHPYHTKDVDARYERPHGGATLRRPAFRDHLEKRELTGASHSYLKRPLFESKRYSSFKGDGTKKTTLSKSKSILKPGHGTKQAEEGPPAKKKKVAAHGLVYLTDIPKEATEQEVMNLARSFGRINNVLLMPSYNEEEDKECGQQASVCMMAAEDAQTFAKAPNLLIRDRVITATVAKLPGELSSDADSSLKAEQGGVGDQSSNKKKGVVLIEDLPESGWTEEDIKALAEPFGYPDNVIIAKQIGKALLIMPDVETAQEMVKVHTFSPASVDGHNVTVKNVYRNISLNTPVALYNLLMHSVDGAVSASKGAVGWVKIVVVSNVPETPYGAFIVHKLVSRIGTVLKTLAVNDQVIFEMATGLLATAVYRHYAKFPCMIQNNPLVFSRKPDPKFPAKVIPAFLDADKDVPEQKKEAPPTTTTVESNQNKISTNPEVKEEDDPMKITTEVAAVTEEENPAVTEEENPAVTEEENPAVTEEENPTATVSKEEPMEMNPEEVVNAAPTEEVVEAEPVEKDQSSAVAPKENGAEVQAEEPKSAASIEGEAAAQNTASQANVAKAVSAEKETPGKAPKPSAPSASSAQKRSSREKSRDLSKNSHRSSISSGREDERRRSDWREKESRDRERRERERSRKDRDYDERSKREYERERRSDPRRDEARRGEPRKDEMRRDDAKREEMKRAWRKEWERREGKRRPYSDADRSDGNRRSSHRDERHRRSSERKTVDDDFPFNLSDFVTVDEVGDVDSEAPETGPELLSDPGLELGSDSQTELASDLKPKLESDPKPGPETQTEESPESRLPQNLPQEMEEKVEDISMEVSAEDPQKCETQEMTEVQPEEQMAEETKESAVPDDVTEEVQAAEITDETCPDAAEENGEANHEEGTKPLQDTPEVTATTTAEEQLKEEASTTEKDKEEKQADPTTAPPAEPKKSENGEKDVTENTQSDKTLPPFDANSSIGLEYLVPMTGFFCKVCTRFFTGAKDAQIGHSKTLKHYENLEKFLKTSSPDGAGSS